MMLVSKQVARGTNMGLMVERARSYMTGSLVHGFLFDLTCPKSFWEIKDRRCGHRLFVFMNISYKLTQD